MEYELLDVLQECRFGRFQLVQSPLQMIVRCFQLLQFGLRFPQLNKRKGKQNVVSFNFTRVEADSRTYTGRARQVAANAKLMMDGIHKAIKMAEHELTHQKNNHA